MPDLWTLAAERTRHAARTGALVPWTTREVLVQDDGIGFSVRLVSSLRDKQAASGPGAGAPGRRSNPFLDPEPDLVVVEDWGPEHRVLLNKFPVLPDHLLITTRAFRPQQAILDEDDFVALRRALDDTDGLGFYNAGPAAGASQPHRHLQVVHPPDTSLARALHGTATAPQAGPWTDAPFPAVVADVAREGLIAALEALGQPSAWNLLASRRRMIVVPRVADQVGGVSVNALGFAGSLFAANEDELAAIQRIGPCAMLRTVTGVTS